MKKARSIVVLAAAVAVFALPAAAADAPTALTAPTQDSITVNGAATASAVPTTSQWSFGVDARAESATAALRATSAELRKVIAALKAAGVAAKDIQTQQVSLQPQYSQDGARPTGYAAANSVAVTLRDVAKTGAIVDGAVGAGATQVSGPSFGTDSSEALYRQALAAAFDDAKAKAQALAARSGRALGKPTAIVEGSSGPIVFAQASRAKAAGAEDVPVEPGESQIQASVTVTFGLS